MFDSWNIVAKLNHIAPVSNCQLDYICTYSLQKINQSNDSNIARYRELLPREFVCPRLDVRMFVLRVLFELKVKAKLEIAALIDSTGRRAVT